MSNRSVTSIERTTNHEEKRMTDSGSVAIRMSATAGTYGLRFMYAVACTESTRAARFLGVWTPHRASLGLGHSRNHELHLGRRALLS